MWYSVEDMCRCDGIGRRSGLKIHRPRGRAGSSPATGTTAAQALLGRFFLPIFHSPACAHSIRRTVLAFGCTRMQNWQKFLSDAQKRPALQRASQIIQRRPGDGCARRLPCSQNLCRWKSASAAEKDETSSFAAVRSYTAARSRSERAA